MDLRRDDPPPGAAGSAGLSLFQTASQPFALADWLVSCRIDTVARESTGVYWRPVYEILEARGFNVSLVNAHPLQPVPGRKSDRKDGQWIQYLHTYGLFSGSFRPEAEMCAVRGQFNPG